MTTPNSTILIARAADGTETDVTEAVQVMYDLVTGSMDWGSGFWSIEDVTPVAEIAKVCGFKMDDIDEYFREQRMSQRRDELISHGVPFRDAFHQVRQEFETTDDKP